MILKQITLTDTEVACLAHDLYDEGGDMQAAIEKWVDGAIRGKINQCKKRLMVEGQPKLLADASVTTMPATEADLIATITARSDYKTRAQKEANSR